MRSLLWFGAPIGACVYLLFACSSSTTSGPASVNESDAAATEPTPESTDDAGEPTQDAGVADAKADVAVVKATWQAGQEGKSCADACRALGKTCVVECTDHRSCGGHDGKSPPYAGYACYYHETKSSSGSFRTNDGRSLMTCDEVASYTWTYYGTQETLGDYLGNNPVSCCCK